MSFRAEDAVAEIRPLVDAFSGRASLAFHHFASGTDLLIDADETLPAASLIKLPILACALAEEEAGRVDLARRIRVRRADHAGGDGVLRLLVGEPELDARDLATLMICVSDNTATNLLIDLLGPPRIEAWMRAEGMARTALVGKLQTPPESWTEAQRRGERNRTSAADVLGLLLRLERGDLLPPDARATMLRILAGQVFTEGIGRYLPTDPNHPEADGAPVVLHSKSGCLAGTWHDAGIVRGADGTPLFALAVLTDGSEDRVEGPDQEGLMVIARCARILWRHVAGA